MKNIVILQKNEKGMVVPVSHVLTQAYEDGDELSNRIEFVNGLEKYIYDYQIEHDFKQSLFVNKFHLRKQIYKEMGELGLTWFDHASIIQRNLTDRHKSLAIAHAICIAQQSVFQQKQVGLAKAFPYTHLYQDAKLFSEPVLRKFIQQNKLYLQYDDMEIDAKELVLRSNRRFTLYCIQQLGIDIGRTSKAEISKLLKQHFDLVMTGGNLRFVQNYL
ncbi:MAG: hypothetical protein OCD00_03795 [Colwellia sp.]